MSSSVLDAHNVRVLGNGSGPVVVLGHGFGSDQSIWKYIVPSLLKNGMKVVLYDLMGASTTDVEDFNFNRYSSYHAFADDLLAVLAELEVERCVYVGHSMSGMIGCLASIERPEIFQKLILLCASPRYLNDANYNGGYEQQDLDGFYASMKSNFRAWSTGFVAMAVGTGGDNCDQAKQDYGRSISAMKSDVALSIAQIIFQSDFRSILPQVTVPCHVVQCQKDIVVPVEVAEYMRCNLGGWASVEILPTDGHFPQMATPGLLIPVLLRCLQGYSIKLNHN